ncbi:hypothetical protein [Gemmatimonas sp. UBA7669]|uniref:hypothetical protein n=1 Tax=Gemmatimonas sp. UBA7669 TaxID=1946568 RepID=UPI0025B8A449|nr:hypothetical protein [Gemmatimonas sp. UBA7669]
MDGEQPASAAGAARTPEDGEERRDIEAVARCVYEAMRVAASPYVETPRWTEGGNSTRQDEARRAAARIVALMGGNAALADARATIARLEGERDALASHLAQVNDELAVDGEYITVEKAILVRAEANRERTRADAAERRVEAVLSEAAEEAAYRVMVNEYGGRVLFSRLSIRLALEAALAAASGAADGAATTEGGR